jgi:ABC-type sugar transport system permease subunit
MATNSMRKDIFQSRRAQKEALVAYFFVLPYLLVTLIFTIGVILFAIYVSFTHFDLYTTPEWVGLENYIKAFARYAAEFALVESRQFLSQRLIWLRQIADEQERKE